MRALLLTCAWPPPQHALTTQDPRCCVVYVSVVSGVRIENGSIVGEGSGIGILVQASPELALENLTFDELGVAVRLSDSRAATLRQSVPRQHRTDPGAELRVPRGRARLRVRRGAGEHLARRQLPARRDVTH